MKTTSQFVRVFQRANKSPWDSVSTTLIYADVIGHEFNSIKLGYTNYIYIHRLVSGEIAGIAVSKQLLLDNPAFTSQYLSGQDMHQFLLKYIEKIIDFCVHFENEFEAIFGLKPRAFWEATKAQYYISKNDQA